MYTDTRKIQIIEAVLKIEDEERLSALEQIILQTQQPNKKRSAHDFVGILSEEDAVLMENAIEESCEQIHPDDWKIPS